LQWLRPPDARDGGLSRPYFGDGDLPTTIRNIPVPMDSADATARDAVLVTHEHVDHVHSPTYEPLVEDLGADIYAPAAAYENPQYDGEVDPSAERKRVIGVGDAFEVGDLTVHVRRANDPDAIEPITYVITHDSGTFFHAGDSRPADAFDDIGQEFDIDVGAIAFGTVGRPYDPERDGGEPTEWCTTTAIRYSTRRTASSSIVSCRRTGTCDRASVPTRRRSSNTPGRLPNPRTVDPVSIGDRIDLDRPGIGPPRAIRE
jgi:L-ascorbate 6-phosphate lactonase